MLDNRVAFVTGASSGIGAASVQALMHGGWMVYATARRVESLHTFAAQGAPTLSLDVTDEGSMQAAVAQIEARHGAIDLLVNNCSHGLHNEL